MSARARVARAQLALGGMLAVRAVAWAAAAFALVLVAWSLVDWIAELPLAARRLAVPGAWLIAGLALATLAWRARPVRSAAGVALWLEERVPALHYALVTLVDGAPANAATALEREVARTSWRAPLARAALRALAVPLAALALAVIALALAPRGVVARVRAPRAGDALARSPLRGSARSHLRPLVATVVPPAYTGAPRVMLEEPSSIAAVVASEVHLEGRGDARTRIVAQLGAAPVNVQVTPGGWRVSVTMPAHPAALRLREANTERLVVLEPQPDSAPVVTLLAPARDTVLRSPGGRLTLAATARDDWGLARGWFEYIVSSGEGETFTFRTGVVRRTTLGGARSDTLAGTLSLDSLGLHPGDVVHVRAVARDRNDATGPGVGSSETRTIRVPRAGEYDSVAVEAAPPPDVDQSQLSERMLITLAEALTRRRPTLAREGVVAESRRIAADQARLRRAVATVIFARLGGTSEGEESQGQSDQRGSLAPDALLRAADSATQAAGQATDFAEEETPVVAVNRPLLEAYNAMWDAGRALDIGEPGQALPHMRAALDAIQRARAAERFFLRGKAPVAVVDLAKVRLAGKRDDAGSSVRSPRAAVDTVVAHRAERLERALELLDSAPAAAVDSLLLVRVDALERAPELAAALGSAVDALRGGRDATEPLARARRLAASAPLAAGGTMLWGGAW